MLVLLRHFNLLVGFLCSWSLELGLFAAWNRHCLSMLYAAADWHSMPKEPVRKMVVMTSRLLSDTHRYILRCLDMHRSIQHCTIFTSISENAHSAYVDAPLGPDAFQEYESLLLQDYHELVLKSNIPKGSGDTEDFERSVQTPQVSKKSNTMENEDWLETTSSKDVLFDLEASSDRMSLHNSSPISMKEEDWKKLQVSVKHFPMIFCPLSSKVFVLPSESAVAEAFISDKSDNSLSPGLPPVSIGLTSDGDDIPPGATLIAHFLHHLAGQMDLKMDIFTLGPVSHTIGKAMTDLSSLYDVGGRTKRSTGLLLIDRSLDLITPCCHGDSLVDRMFSSLPRRDRSVFSPPSHDTVPNTARASGLQRSSVDFKVPLEMIYKPGNPMSNGDHFSHEGLVAFMSGWDGTFGLGTQGANNEKNRELILEKSFHHLDPMYGTLSSFRNHQGLHCLEALLDKHTKDGALLIKKWLQEALRQEKVSIRNRLGGVTASELRTMVNALATNPAMIMRNRGIIQLAKAAEAALSEPWSTRWEAFASAERILMLSAGDTSQSLSGQIQDLINQSVLWRTQNQGKGHQPPAGLLSMRDALILAIVGYSLAGESFGSSRSEGPFSWEEEHSLKEAIVDAILEWSPGVDIGFLHGLEGALESHWQKLQLKNPTEAEQGQSRDTEDHSSIDFDDQWGSWEEDEVEEREQEYGELQLKLELRDRLDNVFRVLHKASKARSCLPFKDRQSNLDDFLGPTSSTNRGLIFKILSMVFGKMDIPGLEYHSSTVGRLFKSGFGRFGLGQAKPRLGDQNLLFVFVVGGFNALEVCEAREAQSSAGADGLELLFGGTTILTPNDMFELLLGSNSHI
ncbi:sec1 family domain-containing protein MIP3 isoform X2 [Cryptomeria japonica]|uniref:sec1 family domain-containing protein MIP3 isoform X2 n=1 Tax=Cryptomeria japonica TaxID=3369 RepID=UPI0025AD906C|nr:sec1 family domain-containing protein MIP3 isoform X2 [Cryptomeria japonica]